MMVALSALALVHACGLSGDGFGGRTSMRFMQRQLRCTRAAYRLWRREHPHPSDPLLPRWWLIEQLWQLTQTRWADPHLLSSSPTAVSSGDTAAHADAASSRLSLPSSFSLPLSPHRSGAPRHSLSSSPRPSLRSGASRRW